MKVIESVAAWLAERKQISGSVGFVPTMGALHSGHESLLQRSRRENEVSIASLFVNPTQFDNPEDLNKYPRTLAGDLAMAREQNTDYLLIPTFKELYPDNYRFKTTDKTPSKWPGRCAPQS